MMAAGLHPYAVNFGSPNMAMHHPHLPSQHIPTNGLDALAEGSQYAIQQIQQQQQQNQQQQALNGLNGSRPPMKHRHSYGTESMNGSVAGEKKGRGANSGQPVRRRISRACDQCNQLRTKCDGKTPCAHCVEFGLTCEYVRERKKRGKASRKDIAAQQAAAGNGGSVDGKDGSPPSPNDNSSDDQPVEVKEQPQQGVKRRRSEADFPPPQLPPPRSASMSGQQRPVIEAVHSVPGLEQGGTVTNASMASQTTQPERNQPRHMSMDQPTPSAGLPTPRLPNIGMSERVGVHMGDYGTMDDYHRSILHPNVTGHNILHSGATAMPGSMIHGGTITGYPESQYGVPSPNSQTGVGTTHFRTGESPISAGFLGQSPIGGSPGWLSLPSPSAGLYPHLQHTQTHQTLRYPVLRPILPHIAAIIPINLACDLLDLYFSSSSSAFMQPQSPYILGYIFRKRSFLRPTNPRVCSPALLASMLWVAAQTSESAFLTSPPSARGKICQKLLELTVGLLKPLIHTSTDSPSTYGANTVINGVALGGFGVGLPGQVQEMEGGSPGATGALDDVATYIHLATVVSASEYKAASLRWWNAAWTLARELKLGRELPPNPEPAAPAEGADATTEAGVEREAMGLNGQSMLQAAASGPTGTSPPGIITEEEREERRRIWWLLYTVDRHLALCYNRPLFLLDVECDGLLQPEHDPVWQAGEYYPPETHHEAQFFRRRGPSFECTGHSIFGYFLPLMTIMGEIADLNHARNHPRFGLRFRNPADWDEQAAEISQQLEAYGRTLKDFEARFTAPPPAPEAKMVDGQHADGTHHEAGTPSVHSVGTNNSGQRMTESILQTKIVTAYGTHLMHTLHILLNGKWDPISLLDDNDLWISSQSFISATSHAVSAAEAINDILEYDPDLSFMPFFFGIYLLQGSFLLLLIADKLQGEASPSVVKACETIVRAHEACVVTLNTEYQVSAPQLSPAFTSMCLRNSRETSAK